MDYAGWALLGFLLLFIYDINTVLWQKRILETLFTVGCLIIGAATLSAILFNWEPDRIYWGYAALALLFAGLLIYTLFFALPFIDTYVNSSKKKQVYTLMFTRFADIPAYCGLSFFTPPFILPFHQRTWPFFSVTACVLNIAYILFQDIWSFPKLFERYDKYQKDTPF
jgi:hypothetical protein